MKYIITESQRERVAIKWMNKMFGPDQLEIVTSPKHPDFIFYKKNGKVVMEQDNKNKNFWFDSKTIWSVFDEFFGFNYDETQLVMKYWLEETLKLEGFTPRFTGKPGN